MTKIKTKKAVAKRFRRTKKNKLLKRTGGQDHFNSREPGKVKRNKRRDSEISKADAKQIKKMIPYNK